VTSPGWHLTIQSKQNTRILNNFRLPRTWRPGLFVRAHAIWQELVRVCDTEMGAVQFLILSGGTLSGGETQRANVVTVRSGGIASGLRSTTAPSCSYSPAASAPI
jgi:hypothetical protein